MLTYFSDLILKTGLALQSQCERLNQHRHAMKVAALLWLLFGGLSLFASPGNQWITDADIRDFVLVKMGWSFFMLLYKGFGVLIFLCSISMWIISLVFNWNTGRTYAFKGVALSAILLVLFPIVTFLINWVNNNGGAGTTMVMPGFGGSGS